MSVSSRRVVITGLGTITPLGIGPGPTWEGFKSGRSGVSPISVFDASKLPVRFAAQIKGFDAKQFIDKKERKNLRVMARAIQLAVAGAQIALDDAKIDKTKIDPTRFGVDFGAGLLPIDPDELAAAAEVSADQKHKRVNLAAWGEKGLPVIPPLWMLKYLPNMLACHVSILHNAQGPSNTITESDVASLLALGEAYHILKRDQADLFLSGGADSKIHPLTIIRQCLFNKLSKRNDEPEKASRPFDRDRDGYVLGEGSGVLILEALDHAEKRGAPIYAEMVGFGAAFDRAMTGNGLARALIAAMKQAGVTPGDLDHVNAHGLSSVKADAWEAKNIHEALGGQSVSVWAPKSIIGAFGAGSGTTEMSASVLAMKDGALPATLNCDNVDPQCPVSVNREPRKITKPYFAKVGFTEMGQCAAVVCRRWEGQA